MCPAASSERSSSSSSSSTACPPLPLPVGHGSSSSMLQEERGQDLHPNDLSLTAPEAWPPASPRDQLEQPHRLLPFLPSLCLVLSFLYFSTFHVHLPLSTLPLSSYPTVLLVFYISLLHPVPLSCVIFAVSSAVPFSPAPHHLFFFRY